MAQKPNIIVSIPVDPAATAGAFKAAADAGREDRVHGQRARTASSPARTMSASVSADEYGNGVASAHLMAKALGGKGDIGLVFHAADFHVTRQRYEAVKATIAKDYPDIKIVAEQGIGGPDFSGDADKAAVAPC